MCRKVHSSFLLQINSLNLFKIAIRIIEDQSARILHPQTRNKYFLTLIHVYRSRCKCLSCELDFVVIIPDL